MLDGVNALVFLFLFRSTRRGKFMGITDLRPIETNLLNFVDLSQISLFLIIH